MEFFKFLIATFCIVFLSFVWRVLNSVWFKPKNMEKILRQQGLNGNSYRFLHGDFKEIIMVFNQAISNPINLSDHDKILSRVLPFFHKTLTKYGKNSFMWMGAKPALLIMDPELMKEIFVKSYEYHKPRNNPLVELLAGGLTIYEEHKWAKHRKIVNPAFHLEKVKLMLPAFYLTCMEMVNKWEDMISNSSSSNGSYELDVWPFLQTLTSDVISRTAFGSNYEEGRKIFELQKEQAEHALKASISLYLPGWRFVPTKMNRRMKEIAKEVDVSIKSIVDKRVISMEDGEPQSDDLLSILLESNLKESQLDSGLTTKEVIEECKLFYFAGQETTSVLLCWTMVLLSKHPKWQERARAEVLQEFGIDKPGYDELNRLKIVTMIFYEVLRLYPPLPALARKTNKDIELGKLSLPGGTHFQLQIMMVHYDNEIWGEDVKEFNPERFSEGILKATKGQNAFFPFSWGPRICLGQAFTMLEVKMALAMILQRFSFELSPSYTHAPYLKITLQPQYGAHIILHKL